MLSIICGRDTKIEAYFSLIIALGPLSRVKENIIATAAAAEFPDVERPAQYVAIQWSQTRHQCVSFELQFNFKENKIYF